MRGGRVITGEHFRKIRRALGLSAYEWGLALGYTGNRNSIQVIIRRYESGEREIPPAVARLAAMFQLHGVPEGFIEKKK